MIERDVTKRGQIQVGFWLRSAMTVVAVFHQKRVDLFGPTYPHRRLRRVLSGLDRRFSGAERRAAPKRARINDGEFRRIRMEGTLAGGRLAGG